MIIQCILALLATLLLVGANYACKHAMEANAMRNWTREEFYVGMLLFCATAAFFIIGQIIISEARQLTTHWGTPNERISRQAR